MNIPSNILPLFKKAGWHPNRQITLEDKILKSIPKEHPAIPILIEFSGLKVGSSGAGEQCAASDVIFGFIDDDDIYEIDLWSNLLKTKLIGIAEVQNRHSELFVDEFGRFFTLHLRNTFCLEGVDFSQAMQNLLLGRRCRPMLPPDVESIMVYGDIYTADSPDVFKY